MCTVLYVFLVAFVMYLLSRFWYSPKVFGKIWYDTCNIKSEGNTKPSLKNMISYYVLCVVMASVISLFVSYNNIDTVQKALWFGFFAWLGFIATSMYEAVIWTKKPLKAYFIDAGYYLTVILVMSVLFSVWC